MAASAMWPTAVAQSASPASKGDAMPAVYAADFVSTAATGTAMNGAGDVAGTSYRDTGCGSFCLPPSDTVVWHQGQRLVLPGIPGFSGVTVRALNVQGWAAGFAGFPGTATRAIVWRPSGSGYQVLNLGVLPGTNSSEAIGIDDLGRVVGWSTTTNFPPTGAPFLWSQATGLVNLADQGFPDEKPLAMSPGGTVATASTWYRLVDPGSVTNMPAAPGGFTVGTGPTAINDDGDQARFLVSTGAEHPVYLFRFNHEGTWQQISFIGVVHGIYGVGSISPARDVTSTVADTGYVAFGPDGVNQPLADVLSPAYPDREVTVGGPMNDAGQILAQMMVGRSSRLMRLVPATACAASCLRVSQIQMQGKFVQDPSDPGHCSPELNAYNLARVRVTVSDETGTPLGGVQVRGRFLDDYWANRPVAGTTNAQGQVQFENRGRCGVGAVAFLVDMASKAGLTFDRTTGVLSDWVIPQI